MAECGLLPETQKEEPEAWAPCPALPLTLKVTLGGNDLTVSCPVTLGVIANTSLRGVDSLKIFVKRLYGVV